MRRAQVCGCCSELFTIHTPGGVLNAGIHHAKCVLCSTSSIHSSVFLANISLSRSLSLLSLFSLSLSLSLST